MWTRQELKSNAKGILKQVYWSAVLVSFVMLLFFGAGGSSSSNAAKDNNVNAESVLQGFTAVEWGVFFSIIATVIVVAVIIDVFVYNPLKVGCYRFFIKAGQDENASWKEMGFAFGSGNYMNIVKTMFLADLYIALWSCLLLIPGCIKAYEYRMIPYLLADDGNLTSSEAFARTKEMMNGQKMNAFILDLSFIPWNILGSITFGIAAIFYVLPYQHLTDAQLYHVLKGDVASAPDQF